MKQHRKKVETTGLCVLHASNADLSRTGRFHGYIAFGDRADCGSGPCVRFHGGTPFSGRLDNAPVMCFTIYGDCHIVPFMWMNPSNCPNAYDKDFLAPIIAFVQSNLPVLLQQVSGQRRCIGLF